MEEAITSKSIQRLKSLVSHISPHISKPSLALRPFTTLHTGINVDPDSAKFEFKKFSFPI
jgi:hypothetical protein